jgi:hypothetical protein
MKNVQRHKTTTKEIKCDIEYNEYEAVFNRQKWQKTAETIDKKQQQAAEDFVNQSTVDCDP